MNDGKANYTSEVAGPDKLGIVLWLSIPLVKFTVAVSYNHEWCDRNGHFPTCVTIAVVTAPGNRKGFLSQQRVLGKVNQLQHGIHNGIHNVLISSNLHE